MDASSYPSPPPLIRHDTKQWPSVDDADSGDDTEPLDVPISRPARPTGVAGAEHGGPLPAGVTVTYVNGLPSATASATSAKLSRYATPKPLTCKPPLEVRCSPTPTWETASTTLDTLLEEDLLKASAASSPWVTSSSTPATSSAGSASSPSTTPHSYSTPSSLASSPCPLPPTSTIFQPPFTKPRCAPERKSARSTTSHKRYVHPYYLRDTAPREPPGMALPGKIVRQPRPWATTPLATLSTGTTSSSSSPDSPPMSTSTPASK